MKQILYRKNGTLSTGPPPKYFTPEIVQVVSICQHFEIVVLTPSSGKNVAKWSPILVFLARSEGAEGQEEELKKWESKLLLAKLSPHLCFRSRHHSSPKPKPFPRFSVSSQTR